MIRVGIVGAGYWPRLVQLPAFQSIPGWHVSGIAAGRRQSAEALAAEFGIPRVYDDYTQLIDDDDIDVVDIVTPNHLHREIAVRAMAAGKHVICIKPLAHTLADAEAMVQAAEDHDRRLFYAENILFTPALRAFKSLVDAGEYGDAFRFTSLQGVGAPHSPWFFDRRLSGGGCIVDMAVHGLAYLDWFAGYPGVSSVYADAGNFLHPAHQVEDTSVVQLRFDDGRMGQTNDSWATPGGYDLRYEVYGSRGHGFTDLLYGQPIRSFTSGHVEGDANSLSYHPVDRHYIKDGHRAMMQHFLDVLRDGIAPQSTGWEGFRVMQLVEAAYASIDSGAQTAVNLVTQR